MKSIIDNEDTWSKIYDLTNACKYLNYFGTKIKVYFILFLDWTRYGGKKMEPWTIIV